MRNLIAIGMCIFLSACAHGGSGGQFAALPADTDEPVAASETINTTGQPVQDLNAYRVLKEAHPELFIWQKAQEINHSVNQSINYRTDDPSVAEVWHVMPTGGQGNCHDYAVTKLFEMIQAGVPREVMRLTVAQVNSTGEYHVMLAVDIPGRGTFFMDSNRENIETASEAKGLYKLWFMENPAAGRMELVG